MQRGNQICHHQRRWCANRKRTRLNRHALGNVIACRILGGGGNRERININAGAVRCAKSNRGQQKNSAPRSNIEHTWATRWELAESTGGAPALQADQRKASGWMQARAERLAWINRDDGIAWGGGVLAPWRANHNAAHAQDGELGAPTRCPLFGRDRSHQQWPDTAQANTAS